MGSRPESSTPAPAESAADPAPTSDEQVPESSEAYVTIPQTVQDTPSPRDPFLMSKEDALEAQRRLASLFRDNSFQQSDHPVESIEHEEEDTERQEFPGAAFKRALTEFNKKKRAKTLTAEDEIEYMRQEAAEKSRRRKVMADAEYDKESSSDVEPEGLFVSEEETELPSTLSDNDGDSSRRSKKREAPVASRPRKKAKVAGHNYTDENFQAIIDEVNQKTFKPPKKNTKGKRTKLTGPPLMNTQTLRGTDVFADALKTANLPKPPTFQATKRKGDAFKQLVASIPQQDRAKNHDKRWLDQACKAFTGVGSVKAAPDGNWSVKGLKTTLKAYQVLGVAFMRKREADTTEPRGGMLCDQMGLGKTISMLANIVNGKAPEKSKLRTTLIVAAPALITQWIQEIEAHCMTRRESKHGLGKVVQYRAGHRIESNMTREILQEADIVLTTYHELARSYPKAVVPTQLTTASQKEAWWKEHFDTHKGILHDIKFLRIVLDEAHAIKNHLGHTSMACRAVHARFHWAITGTPILNSTLEIYPYFKFLRVPHTGSYKVFKENFCSPDDPTGTERLNVFLRRVMCRRTHLDTLFGARLLDLPTPKEHTLWLDFNPVERSIYEIVKARMVQRINAISKFEGVEKQYSHVWTMILRLRQLCGHIFLIQGTIFDILQREDFEKLSALLANGGEAELGEDCSMQLVQLSHALEAQAGIPTASTGVGDTVITTSESTPISKLHITPEEIAAFGGGTHGLNYGFQKYLDSLRNSGAHWEAIKHKQRCVVCQCREPVKPMITSCFHIFCAPCLESLGHAAARRGQDAAKCPVCCQQFTGSQALENPQDDNAGPASEEGPQTKKKTKKKTKKDSNKENKKDSNKENNQETKKENEPDVWVDMKGEVLPSTKTTATKSQIMTWLKESSNCKIIVYTQFLPIIKILYKMCIAEGWKAVKYSGELSHEARGASIADFGDPTKDVQIMLASLRCGGLGLNLTMASRVILFDPYWNNSLENQAFCRVYRIGQTSETRMSRFVVKNTIDAAMMQIKEQKQIEIDELMEHKQKNLDVHEIMGLFGRVEEDENGRPFIFVDEEDEEDHMRLREVDSEDEEVFMGN